LPTGNHRTLPQETQEGVTAENDKTAFGSDDALVVLVYPTTRTLFLSLAWLFLTLQRKVFFQNLEELNTK